MGVLYTPSNVVVGQAIGYYGEVGATVPANTVPYGGDWGVSWVNPGATEEGWRLNGDTSTTAHNIEEQPNPVLNTIESRTMGIAASLAEDTLESLRLAFAGGTIVVGTGADVGVRTFKLSNDITEFAVGLDMKTVGGKCRRVIIPRASGAGTVDVAFRRSAAKRMWPVQFTALCRPDEIIIRDITPA